MRRGQAEVVAALLMTVVVVGGFALLWLWLYPRYLEWERSVSEAALAARAAAGERVVVELLRCSGGVANITLLSTGSVGVRVAAVYVNETLVWSGSLYLAPGQRGSVVVGLPCGSLYRVKVCSSRGSCWTYVELGL